MAKSGSKLKVLVADDDPIQRSLIAARLLALDGVATEAEDGTAAWRLLHQQHFDLAIVDLEMPGLDGFGLIQCMRGHPRTRHLPVVVVTSRTDGAAIRDALAAGASSFLTKPVVWSTFEHHIGFLLRLAATAEEARHAAQLSRASDRAHAAIVQRVCSETTSAAAAILADIEELQSGRARRNPDAFLERLRNIAISAQAMDASAAAARAALGELSGGLALTSKRASLAGVLASVVEANRPMAEEVGITVDVSLPEFEVRIACDADAICLALNHLLRNAIAHSPPGVPVEVKARMFPDGLLAIEVHDQGAGMDPELVRHCLAPALSGCDDVVAAGSVGFGLLIAKAVAEAHNGVLELHSMSGRGTTALLVMPPDRVVSEAA